MKKQPTPHAIKRLELTAFRGASSTLPAIVEFDTTKRLAVLFGENGTGKSSIVDAIEAVCKGRFGSLESLSQVKPAKHAVALNRQAAHMALSLHTHEALPWQAHLRSGKWFSTPPTSPTTAELPMLYVLRRPALLGLIDNTPGERYKAFQQFLAVDGVEDAEAQLNKLRLILKGSVDAAITSLGQAGKDLNVLYDRDGSAAYGSDVRAWAQHLTDQSIETLRARLVCLTEVATATTRARTDIGQWLTDETAALEATALHQAAVEALAEAATNDVRQHELAELLDKAATYLALTEPTACPVCAQPVLAADLRARIAAEQATVSFLLTLARTRDEAAQALHAARAIADRNQQRATEAHTALIRALALAQAELPALPEFPSPGAEAGIVVKWADWEAYFAEKQGTVATETNDLQARTQLHDGAKRLLKELAETEQRAAELTAEHDRIEAAIKIIRDERLTFVQEILDSIKTDVNAYFGTLHPGEKIDLHRLAIDLDRRASIDLYGNYHGVTTETPLAYMSESHLDTLGFCIWLAIAKRDNVGRTVLVLDDVFTSVDRAHFRRITELLCSVSGDFQQIIVTTHSQVWSEFFKKELPNDCHHLKLARWSLAGGLAVYPNRLATADLIEHLNAVPFDAQCTAAKAGILLEWMLERTIREYKIAMPLDDQYTLGALLQHTRKKLHAATITRPQRDSHGAPEVPLVEQTVLIDTLFGKVDALSFIRDRIGCHADSRAQDLSDVQAHEFGESVLALADALHCPECGHLPKPRKDGIFRCSCPGAPHKPHTMIAFTA